MRIYWIVNGQQCGPASVPDIISKLQLGELEPHTLGWHSGCDNWLPLCELPALADYFTELSGAQLPPDQEPAAQVDSQSPLLHSSVIKVMLAGPATRFLARLVDMALYATLMMGIMYFLQVPYKNFFHPGTVLFWLPMVLIEAYMVRTWGGTPGKFWLGIRLQSIKGQRTFADALKRSILVFILGVGCMNALLLLVCMGISFFAVWRRGVTLWDIQSASLPVVLRAPSVAKRWLVGFFLFIAMHLCGTYMQPWVPDMINEIRESSPEMAHKIEEWMPR